MNNRAKEEGCMKNIVLSLAVAVVGATGLAMAGSATVSAKAAPSCQIVTVGNTNTANKPHSVFKIHNGVARVAFVAKGKKNCEATVALKSWITLKEGGRPHKAQQLHVANTKTVGRGKHMISVQMPPKGCYYQVDFVKIREGQPNKILAYNLRGNHSCIEKPEEPKTPPKTPETPTVKKVVKVTEVKELPHTGIVDGVMQVMGATGLTGSAAYYLRSRRDLFHR